MCGGEAGSFMTVYLLPELEDQWGQGVHGCGAQLWGVVQGAHYGVDDARGVVCEVQGLGQSVQGFQGNPAEQEGGMSTKTFKYGIEKQIPQSKLQ